MPDHNEPFTPRSVDEQIEQFLPHPEQRHQAITPETELIMDMHDLYRDYAGARDRVRRRLQGQMASRSRAAQANMGTVRSLAPERQPAKRNKNMYAIETSPIKTRTLKPRLALIAATLFAALLIVALVVIVPFARLHSTQPNTPAGINTQTPPSVSNQAGSLYITNSSGILKLAPNTGKTLNSYPWPNKGIYHTGGTIEPYTLLISGKLLFVGFKLINSDGNLIYGGVQAFDTSKGQMLWEFDGTTSYQSTLTIANGTVYLSVDHPGIANNSLVFALKATDGSQLATYTIPLPIYKLVVTHGFLYAKSYGDLYALNLATKAHWSKNGPQGAEVGFKDFQMVNGVLYAAAYNGPGSFFVMLNAETGVQLWLTKPIAGEISNFTIVKNVAYFGTNKAPSGASNDNVGRFDAYDFSRRTLLWETPVPGVTQAYAVINGTVYAATWYPYAGGAVDPKLIAFDGNHGNILWSVAAGSQDVGYAPVVTNGSIYIAATDQPQYPGRQIEMVDQTSGKTLWKTSFSSQIGGYVVISA
ncbi:MAG TPA: PQQ-binding-like beta-propeller repeat protein [Ktedonobacteraceae bacterium]|nr:PQQ-binding-like beta-propeller repeat protein [Ktedonobacteraceae bacterium]